jgi:chloramphenicol 3-O phosphotransferase
VVIVVNGGSSSGKTSIVRHLRGFLVEPWLAASIDGFVDSLPAALQDSAAGFGVTAEGAVLVGEVFRRLEAAWMAGIAATVRAGAPVIVDDVFLGAAASQARWRAALDGLSVAWVGVRCDPAVARRREASRPDREPGMAVLQADEVHRDVVYDVEVDTTSATAEDCARTVVTTLHMNGPARTA